MAIFAEVTEIVERIFHRQRGRKGWGMGDCAIYIHFSIMTRLKVSL